MNERYAWLWDVEMDAKTFERCLQGEQALGRFDPDWALLRLLEYAPYREIRRLLPVRRFIRRWPDLAPRMRSAARRGGTDFLRTWLMNEGDVDHE